MSSVFKIGDKVMLEFRNFSDNTLKIETIISETKTLWKTENYTFKKDEYNEIRGYGSRWNGAYAKPYNEKIVKAYTHRVFLANAKYFIKESLTPEQEDSLIEWYKTNKEVK